jgi:hypothetical protein
MKEYRRITGCMARPAADKLWHELAAFRRATGQPRTFTRRKYGTGYALYEVTEMPRPEDDPDGADAAS